LATQNPIEQEGTYPLPEAQRDRFIFHVVVGYPDRAEEGEIIDRTTRRGSASCAHVLNGEQILRYQEVVRDVPLPDNIKQFVLDLVRILRPRDPAAPDWVKQYVEYGPGPRASQQLVLGGKARALLHRRHHVTIADIEALALPALRHRLVPTFTAEAEGISTDDLIRRALSKVRRPAGSLL
jgi:MoxR-like ATPase